MMASRASARLMTADDGKPSEARLMMASLIWLDCVLHQRQSYDGLAH
jgi:hypothetical protein